MTDHPKLTEREVENPPAFPCTGEGYGSPLYTQKGMSLRDWFAGQVATGWLAGVIIDGEVGYTLQEPETLARKFYSIADAMLAARVSK